MNKKVCLILSCVLLCNGCSTLDESFRLGGTAGALTGAAATYAAGSSTGANPTLQDVGIGASIGLGIGLITSYFVHKAVVAEREDSNRQTELYFGDLPPSPFIVPKQNSKKGAR